MSLKVTRIEAEDFMCFGKVDFDLSECEGKITLVEGFRGAGRSNGAGKSVFAAELVTWCLFGSTCRKLSKAVKVIRRGAEMCWVRVTLLLGEDSIVVERGRRKTGPYLHVSGITSSGTVAGVQDRLEAAIGYTYETWTKSVVYSGIMSKFCQLTDAERKDLLQRMLGADVYADAAKVAAARLSILQGKAADFVNRQAELTGKLGSLRMVMQQQFSEGLVRAGRVWRRMVDQARKNSALAEAALEACEAFSAWLRKEKRAQDEARVLLDSIDANRAECEKEQAALTQQIEELRRQEGAAVQQIDGIGGERRAYVDSDHPAVCPTCKRPWPKNVTAQRMQKVLEQLDARKAEADGILAKIRSKIEKVLMDRRSIQDRLREILAKRKEVFSVVDTGTGQGLLTKAITLEHDLREGQRLLDGDAEAWDPEGTPEQTRDLQRQMEEAKDEQRECLDAAEKLREEADRVLFWKEGFGRSGLPAFLIDSSIPDMNAVAADVAARLSDGELTVRFDPAAVKGQGDVFAVQVDYREGADAYEEASNGEHLRVDMATLMSIRELVNTRAQHPCTFLVIDEVLDGADEAFAAAFFQMLRERHAGLSILLISHTGHVRSLADQIVTVRKESGMSKIDCVAAGSS